MASIRRLAVILLAGIAVSAAGLASVATAWPSEDPAVLAITEPMLSSAGTVHVGQRIGVFVRVANYGQASVDRLKIELQQGEDEHFSLMDAPLDGCLSVSPLAGFGHDCQFFVLFSATAPGEYRARVRVSGPGASPVVRTIVVMSVP